MTTSHFSRDVGGVSPDSIAGWIHRLERLCKEPPPYILDARLEEYRVLISAALLTLRCAKSDFDTQHARPMMPNDLDQEAWIAVQKLMSGSSLCAFYAEAETVESLPVVEVAQEDVGVMSGTRLRAGIERLSARWRKRDAG